MMEGFGEIMTLEETAKYLKIGKFTLYKMAREGKIPAVEIKSKNTKSRDVSYIQKLSEHNSSKEVFTHVSTKDLSAIKKTHLTAF